MTKRPEGLYISDAGIQPLTNAAEWIEVRVREIRRVRAGHCLRLPGKAMSSSDRTQ